MATTAERAREYAEMGLRVLPLSSNSKVPATKHGCKDASSSVKDIEEWTKDGLLNGNIGIATGDGLVVIDCDVHGDDNGINNLMKTCAELKIDPPITATVSTPSGGKHFYYRTAKGQSSCLIKNSVSKVSKSVDVRSDGGYVVAPPSSIDGNGYKEAFGRTIAGNIAELTDDLYTLLVSGREAYRSEEQAKAFDDARAEGRARFRVGSTGKTVNIAEGTRNDTMFKMACSFRAQGLEKEAVLPACLGANAATEKPLSKSEVKACVESAFRYDDGEKKPSSTAVAEGAVFGELLIGSFSKGKFKPKANTENVSRVLSSKTDIWYDTLTQAVMVRSAPWREEAGQWENADYTEAAAWIDRTYGFDSSRFVKPVVSAVAKRNKTSQVKEYLEGLKWDGRKRADTLLIDCLGAADTQYVREATRLWLRGAVARAKNPGCKFDYLLTIQGPQGIGKSYILQKLAHNKDWENDNLSTIDGDKAFEKIRGKWIVELAELLAVKKTREVEALKAFVTSQTDCYRTPYEQLSEDRPRCCVFAATTNEDTFLTDITGNRRYLTVVAGAAKPTVSMFDEDFDKYVDQVWAEVQEEEDGSPLVLSETGAKEQAEANSAAAEEVQWRAICEEWVRTVNDIDEINAAIVAAAAIGITPVELEGWRSKEINSIIKATGRWKFIGRKSRSGYGKVATYELIEKKNEEATTQHTQDDLIPF